MSFSARVAELNRQSAEARREIAQMVRGERAYPEPEQRPADDGVQAKELPASARQWWTPDGGGGRLGNTTRDNFPALCWGPAYATGDGASNASADDDEIRAALSSGDLYRRRLRRVHQEHFARSKNQQKCGRCRCSDAVELHADDGGGYFRGLVTCGSGTACPVCGAAVAREKGIEIATAVGRWLGVSDPGADEWGEGRRGDVLFLTFTLRHDASGDLAAMLEGLQKSIARTRSGSGWAKKGRGWRDRLGVEGTVRGLDATYGGHGWHPHFHYLWFCDGSVSDSELRAFVEWIRGRWESALVRELGESARPEWDIGVQVERVERSEVGRYIAKLGIAREVSSGLSTKEARAGHRTPFEILADFAEGAPGERVADGGRWKEWVEATHGRSLVHWSHGLREKVIPDLREADDVELAEREIPRPWLLAMSADTWDRVVHVPDAPEVILAAARAYGEEGAAVAIAEALRVAPDEPGRLYRRLQNDERQARIVAGFGERNAEIMERWVGLRKVLRAGGAGSEAPVEEYRLAFREHFEGRMMMVDRAGNLCDGGR